MFATIAALPAASREVLVAVDVAGLSYGEAARAMRLREGTITSRLFRAREQVAKALTGTSHRVRNHEPLDWRPCTP